MTDECPHCGLSSGSHAEGCLRVAMLDIASEDRTPNAHRTAGWEAVKKASREDMDSYMDSLAAWDDESPHRITRYEYRVVYKRASWQRVHVRIFQREYYAKRLFTRLARQEPYGRAGLSRIVILRLERREVPAWEFVQDLPWLR